MREWGHTLIFFGGILILIGGVMVLADKIPGIGRLPGDIVIRRKNVTFFFPLTTCLLISLIVSFLLWLFRRP